VTRTADEAAAAAQSLGFPVVLKALSDKLLHKSDIGAVLLDLADEAAVRRGAAIIAENARRAGLAEPLEGLLVCEQVQGGTELAFGAQRDPEMGSVVMAGSGGVLLELMHDVCFAALPLTLAEARKLIERTRVAHLLGGYRGARAHDMNALALALLAVAQLAEDLDESLSSIDVNPVVSRPNHQPVALDAVIVLRGVGARS